MDGRHGPGDSQLIAVGKELQIVDPLLFGAPVVEQPPALHVEYGDKTGGIGDSRELAVGAGRGGGIVGVADLLDADTGIRQVAELNSAAAAGDDHLCSRQGDGIGGKRMQAQGRPIAAQPCAPYVDRARGVGRGQHGPITAEHGGRRAARHLRDARAGAADHIVHVQ